MSLLEKVFSVKNKWKNGNKYKIITIFGIRICFKTKNANSLANMFPLCEIPNQKEMIAKRTVFPHPIGIVISKHATIGKNCWIYQNVTIGTDKYYHSAQKQFYPKIGDNVIIYAGAVVAGGITIGNGAIIGANAVVLSDIPEDSVAVGVPAKVVKIKKDN